MFHALIRKLLLELDLSSFTPNSDRFGACPRWLSHQSFLTNPVGAATIPHFTVMSMRDILPKKMYGDIPLPN